MQIPRMMLQFWCCYYRRPQFQTHSVINGPLILVCKLMQNSQSRWILVWLPMNSSANQAENTNQSHSIINYASTPNIPVQRFDCQSKIHRACPIWTAPELFSLNWSSRCGHVTSLNVAMDTKGVKHDLRWLWDAAPSLDAVTIMFV